MELNQLAVVEKMSAAEIFTSGRIDDILSKICDEARGVKVDISTEKGRKEVASLAYRIARSKTFLDDLGKKLGEDAKARLDAINAERKRIRDGMDSLKDEVRKPLTDWENTEKDRVSAHEAAIAQLERLADECERGWQRMTMDELDARLAQATNCERDWEEFRFRAESTKDTAVSRINQAKSSLSQHLQQQEEIARLKAAEAERVLLEREEQIRKETEERVKREAEAAAKAEAEKAQEAIRKAERKKHEAEMRAEAERKAKIEADERAKAAAKKAEEDLRARQEAEAAAAKAAEEKRERNRRHVAKINNEVVSALVKFAGITDDQAKDVVKAIATGSVPNTKILY